MPKKIKQLFRDWDDTVEYPAGSVIFAERDPADCMYVVLRGEVELTLHGKVLGVESQGGVVGEMAMLGSETRDGTATARSNVVLARLDDEGFHETMRRSTDFSLLVMGGLASRLRAVDAFISSGKGKKA